jgi:hypothetical protein
MELFIQKMYELTSKNRILYGIGFLGGREKNQYIGKCMMHYESSQRLRQMKKVNS